MQPETAEYVKAEVSDASLAHVQALVEIAFDIEAQLTPRSSN
jgi:hypothetical protein